MAMILHAPAVTHYGGRRRESAATSTSLVIRGRTKLTVDRTIAANDANKMELRKDGSKSV